MSRQNPIAAVLEKMGRREATENDFLAVWNDPNTAVSYRGEYMYYDTRGRERVIKITSQGGTPCSVTWSVPKSLSPEHHHLMWEMVAYYNYAEQGWDFVPAFLQNQQWSAVTVWAWTGYVMAKELSLPQQKILLKKLGIDVASNAMFVCALSGALIPAEFGEQVYVTGVASVVFNRGTLHGFLMSVHPSKTQWQYHSEMVIRIAGRNKTIWLGWFPSSHPQMNVRINSLGVLTAPKCSSVMEYFSHECVECHTYIKPQDRREDSCLWCLEKKYPHCEVKPYTENALRHVKVQVSLKKPFIMPAHPVKWLTPILLGCELEYNCAEANSLDARLSLLKHLDKFVIFKHDGSLSEGGFEIVTAPADLPMHKLKFQPVFAHFPEALEIGERTGMHIHLDRNALSPLMLGRMVEFMHNPANKTFIETIGERPCNNYSNQTGMGYRHVLEKDVGGTRYHTLNISPEKTVEFRIFKAPATYASFVKNLEFVVALLQYFRTGWTNNVPKEGKKFELFLDYLKKGNRSRLEARNESPYLFTYLKEKRVL